jgi:hypothetical protein
MVKIIYCIECGRKLAKSAFYHKSKRCRLHCFLKGKAHPAYGKHPTKETRMKMSLAGKDRPAWNKGKSMPKGMSEKMRQILTGKMGLYARDWKGGKTIHTAGYVYLYSPDHPFHDNKKYVFEHRLVVEKIIGRYLEPTERVHHINEVKADNRPQNLMAFTSEPMHKKFERTGTVPPDAIIFDGRKFHL